MIEELSALLRYAVRCITQWLGTEPAQSASTTSDDGGSKAAGTEQRDLFPELSEARRDLLKFEYQQAQDMLKHYDTLTWQTGNIFIAAIAVLTGLIFSKDGTDVLEKGWRSLIVVAGVPSISFVILSFWAFWFRRHRGLYQFRDDVLHRLEIKLGFYHFLRVAEENARAAGALTESQRAVLGRAKAAAYSATSPFEAVADRAGAAAAFPHISPTHVELFRSAYKRPSSYALVWRLVFTLPLLQFTGLFLLWWTAMRSSDVLFDTAAPLPVGLSSVVAAVAGVLLTVYVITRRM